MGDFNLLLSIITIAVVVGVVLGGFAYLTLLERWIAAWVQDRKGPNRVGPWGLFQPLADGAKFLFKEEVVPRYVDRLFYMLGPCIATMMALLALSVVPFGRTTVPPDLIDYRAKLTDPNAAAPPVWPLNQEEELAILKADAEYAKRNNQPTYEEKLAAYNQTYQFVIAPHLDIGIVFVFAIGSLTVYAIILGGWSSNNKYSMLGSLRASAQIISYEIPMGMSILGVVLLTGSLNLERVIDHQVNHGWNFLFQPLAALLFITAVFAECNRLPFDLPECEQELVAGYHTEYSGMKFALFMIGEYTHVITTSFLVMVLFFGGWHLPFLADVGGVGGIILKLIILCGKMFLFIIFYMMVRWTLPRFRFDQLMGLAWKVLLPLALANLVAVLVVKHLMVVFDAPGLVWVLLPVSLVILVGAAYVTLLLPKPPASTSRYVKGQLTTAAPVAR
jgi:NADH-quinone oxidoreductase subunit H